MTHKHEFIWGDEFFYCNCGLYLDREEIEKRCNTTGLREALLECFYVLSMQDRDTDKWRNRRYKAMQLSQEVLENTQ